VISFVYDKTLSTNELNELITNKPYKLHKLFWLKISVNI